VQDNRAGLHVLDCSPILPCRAKQNELCITAVDVHGDGPATGTSNYDIWLMLVELSPSGLDCQHEVIVIKRWVDDFVAVVLQVGRFDAAWDRVPAVKEEDFHFSPCSTNIPANAPSIMSIRPRLTHSDLVILVLAVNLTFFRRFLRRVTFVVPITCPECRCFKEVSMAEANAMEPTSWPDLAMSLWDGLTGRKAEITYHFDHLEVSVPHYVGEQCKYAVWKLNGVLKIRTSDKTQA